LDVDAHPTRETSRNAERTVAKRLGLIMMTLLVKKETAIYLDSTTRSKGNVMLATLCGFTTQHAIDAAPAGFFHDSTAG
jgi:hypothetical protein